MFPDGTTLLLDAGDAGGTNDDRVRVSDTDERPDASRTPAQWITRYIRHMAGPDARLDYVVLTHFHGDHIGAITGSEPLSTHGDYRLRGITEIAESLPIVRLIDRGWPDYSYLPPPASDKTYANYRRFVAESEAAGSIKMFHAEAGSATQIRQVRKPQPGLPFEVRIVAVNDRVWTGNGDATKIRFPALDSIPVREDWPDQKHVQRCDPDPLWPFRLLHGRGHARLSGTRGGCLARRGNRCRTRDWPDRCARRESPRVVGRRESVLAGDSALARHDCAGVGGDASLTGCLQANAVDAHLPGTAGCLCDPVPRSY